jgi:hypothetical protein
LYLPPGGQGLFFGDSDYTQDDRQLVHRLWGYPFCVR